MAFALDLRAAEPLPSPERVDPPTPAYARDLEVGAETSRLLQAGDIDGLEALADRLRKSHEALDGGTWMLSTFYDCAVVVPSDKASEAVAMDFYERWARERPDSITAQVCFADALASYAWNARGDGWANSVTEEAGRLFQERLDRAWDVLRHASTLADKCPGWYSVAQTVALGQGWDRLEFMMMVDEAIRREPSFGNYYTRTCYWLLPRWYGETGTFEKWIAEQADRSPLAERDRQYARYVWMADRIQIDSEMVFAPGRLDWERTQRGFAVLLKEKPGNLMVQFELTRLALLANDRGAARSQFERTGGKYFPEIWGGKVARFEQARRFAYENGPNPLYAASPPGSGPELSPEVLARIKLGGKLLSGFVGGLLAGVFLLVLAAQRGRTGAGAAALVGSVLLATAFGTAATIIPGALLWLYLKRQALSWPPDIAVRSGWMILLWLLVLACLDLGLQATAGVLAAVPLILENGHSAEDAMFQLFSNGTVFLIGINAFWIVFLVLLAICRPLNRKGWQDRLGLHPCAIRQTLLWALLFAIVIVGLNFAGNVFRDDRTRAAVQLISEGIQSPGVFLLAVVFAAPVVEELIFRGFAYAGWINKLGFWGTAFASSAIFAGLHLQYGWLGLIGVFILGLALMAVRHKTGSVYPCMALHMLNNAVSILGLHFLNQGS